MNEFFKNLATLQQKLQPFAELAQQYQNLPQKINPQVSEMVAALHSKIATNPALLNSIQQLADKFKQIEPIVSNALKSDSFKALVVNINNTQPDKLPEINENDFENFMHQIETENNVAALEQQTIKNPILFFLLIFFLQHIASPFSEEFFKNAGSDVYQFFAKPQLENLQDKFENNMDETRVLTNAVNLREAPQKTAKSLLKIEANQTIKVLSKSGNWFKVRYFYSDNEYIEGWVFKKYSKKV
ncbi:MAG: SH3 domain-containing protein [Campylobacterales bacterium]|nr:SH3 domain-containing protein [Campylobacterales bacterium]